MRFTRLLFSFLALFAVFASANAFAGDGDSFPRSSRLLFIQPNATADASPIDGVYFIAARHGYHTDVTIDNATSADVIVPTTNVIIGPQPSTKVVPNGVTILDKLCDREFDCSLDDFGTAVIPAKVVEGVELSTSIRFSDGKSTSAFDVPFLRDSDSLKKNGDWGVLRGLRNTDAEGTFLVVYNRSDLAFLTLQIVDGAGHWLGTEYWTTPRGLSSGQVKTRFPAGRIYVQAGTTGVGPAPVVGQHYVFAAVGPPTGTSQRVVPLARVETPPAATATEDTASVLLSPRPTDK